MQLETSVQLLSATEREREATAAQLAQSIALASCSLRGLRTGRRALQCVAVCCSVLQCVAVRIESALQCVAVRIESALQCVAVRISTCKYYSKHCNAGRCVGSGLVDILTAIQCNALDHMLQHTATRVLASCSLHELETGRQSHCTTLQHTASLLIAHCNALQRTATHCSTLQHTAAHCGTLQHTTTHYNTLQHTATHCNTLQHTATHCNTLQHTATHCNMPQRRAQHE